MKEIVHMSDDVRIQAEIGGAARIDPGIGVQRPGYMIRDFTLRSSRGEGVRLSDFRERANLVLVFAGHSDAMRVFLQSAAGHSRQFSEQETCVISILSCAGKEPAVRRPDDSSILKLYDEVLAAHYRSGATDGNGHLIPVIYVTDRFGEIVAAYVVQGDASPPSVEDILRTLEFVNHQCPECEPPEWPR